MKILDKGFVELVDSVSPTAGSYTSRYDFEVAESAVALNTAYRTGALPGDSIWSVFIMDGSFLKRLKQVALGMSRAGARRSQLLVLK